MNTESLFVPNLLREKFYGNALLLIPWEENLQNGSASISSKVQYLEKATLNALNMLLERHVYRAQENVHVDIVLIRSPDIRNAQDEIISRLSFTQDIQLMYMLLCKLARINNWQINPDLLATQEQRNYHSSEFVRTGLDICVLRCMTQASENDDELGMEFTDFIGPDLPNICVLATCKKSWDCILTVSSHQGLDILNTFIQARYGLTILSSTYPIDIATVTACQVTCSGQEIDKLELDTLLSRINLKNNLTEHEENRHPHVILGGTFDHLHMGHKFLLSIAANLMSKRKTNDDKSVNNTLSLSIGVTDNAYSASKAYASYIQDWSIRCESVKKFLLDIFDFFPCKNHLQNYPDYATQVSVNSEISEHGITVKFINGVNPTAPDKAAHLSRQVLLELRIISISDMYGPTVTDPHEQLLVITKETAKGGAQVNEMRQTKGFKPLTIETVNVILDDYSQISSDENAITDTSLLSHYKLSSTNIRKEIANKLANYAEQMP